MYLVHGSDAGTLSRLRGGEARQPQGSAGLGQLETLRLLASGFWAAFFLKEGMKKKDSYELMNYLMMTEKKSVLDQLLLV